MSETQEGIQPEEDFAVNIYRGCVLPEDYKPARTTSWAKWSGLNPDGYSAEQLDTIKRRLQAGKSWVCFMKELETISAPESYKPLPPYSNPIRPKDKLT